MSRASTAHPHSRSRRATWQCCVVLCVVLCVVWAILPLRTAAQPTAPAGTPFCAAPTPSPAAASVDVQGLRAVYCSPSQGVHISLSAAHVTAYPVFYGAVPAAWAGAWLQDRGDYTDAYRLTVTQLVTYGTVVGLKRAVGRPRPYATLPLVSQSARYADVQSDGTYESFPSGHAALSAAIAASWSWSHPRWFVIAPAATWATAVALSRLHLGVHYPSDIFAGAVLGVGIATAVHLVRDTITPDALTPEAAMDGPSVTVRVRL